MRCFVDSELRSRDRRAFALGFVFGLDAALVVLLIIAHLLR